MEVLEQGGECWISDHKFSWQIALQLCPVRLQILSLQIFPVRVTENAAKELVSDDVNE